VGSSDDTGLEASPKARSTADWRTKQTLIPYRSALKERARELRKKMTLAEILLWKRLKGKQLCGYDFDRQRPVGRRIVDFYCKDLALVVDVDGSVHDFTRKEDERRQRELESLGLTVLRFWNHEVKTDIGSVVKRIEEWVRTEEQRRGWPKREAPIKVSRCRAERRRKPTPDPSQGGEQTADVVRQTNIERSPKKARGSSPPGRGQVSQVTATDSGLKLP
jgi:very-short-patch-repair endonuclease